MQKVSRERTFRCLLEWRSITFIWSNRSNHITLQGNFSSFSHPQISFFQSTALKWNLLSLYLCHTKFSAELFRSRLENTFQSSHVNFQSFSSIHGVISVSDDLPFKTASVCINHIPHLVYLVLDVPAQFVSSFFSLSLINSSISLKTFCC